MELLLCSGDLLQLPNSELNWRQGRYEIFFYNSDVELCPQGGRAHCGPAWSTWISCSSVVFLQTVWVTTGTRGLVLVTLANNITLPNVLNQPYRSDRYYVNIWQTFLCVRVCRFLCCLLLATSFLCMAAFYLLFSISGSLVLALASAC